MHGMLFILNTMYFTKFVSKNRTRALPHAFVHPKRPVHQTHAQLCLRASGKESKSSHESVRGNARLLLDPLPLHVVGVQDAAARHQESVSSRGPREKRNDLFGSASTPCLHAKACNSTPAILLVLPHEYAHVCLRVHGRQVVHAGGKRQACDAFVVASP